MAKQKAPEIDWLLAVCLERKQALSWRFDELGAAVGYSADYCQKRFNESPCDWPKPFRDSVFRVFGIDGKIKQKIILLLE